MWGRLEALKLFLELLPGRTRALGADHPDELTTRNGIDRLADGSVKDCQAVNGHTEPG